MPKSEEQRTIELIEDSPFSPQDKYKLLLCHLRARPACTVSIASGVWRQGSEPKKIDHEAMLDAVETLERVKSDYGRADPVKEPALPGAPTGHGERFHEVVKFLVAQDQFVLKTLKVAVKNSDHKKLGQMYGYPLTSIEALGVDHGIVPLAELSPGEIMTDAGRFLDFPLSRKHWPSELRKVRGWVEIVKRHSPVIYEQVRMANWCRLNEEQVDGMFGRMDGRRTSTARQTSTV